MNQLFTKVKCRASAKAHGGKSRLCREIISHFPTHKQWSVETVGRIYYFEPFVYTGSVATNLHTGNLGIVRVSLTDLDPAKINLLNVIKYKCDKFVERLSNIEYCQASFDWSIDALKHVNALEDPEMADDIYWAAAFIVNNRMSRGGLGKTFAWSERQRGGQPGDLNAWKTMMVDLKLISDRLSNYDIYTKNGLFILWKTRCSPNTLLYMDPPYLIETRTAKKAYGKFECTDKFHRVMLKMALRHKGKIIISGYRSKLYDTMLAGWRRIEFDVPNNSGQGKTKQRRIECIWLNYDEKGNHL